jgi:LmbE family N-acetylglucosaminyl deacetylase
LGILPIVCFDWKNNKRFQVVGCTFQAFSTVKNLQPGTRTNGEPEMKRCWPISFLLLLLLALSGLRAGNRNAYPLPEDRGTAGTLAALEKLPVYVRLLETTAHPDDETAGTLTWLSRKFHARTALFCLTRGEGGQNILGSEKYQALGLVRTGELLEACKYYGTELYFGTVLDFGFSKTAQETLSKWGHDATLEEMVRFMRRWRPTIVISRFQGTPADGHGHHQAAGILTREAFRAVSDPRSFPGQLKDGLEPWQPRKLYVSIPGFGGPAAGGNPEGPAGWTVRVPVGDYDPVLGRSCREIGSEGYSKHRSQGDGAAYSMPGQAYEYFRLEDSIVGIQPKEESFFDSIDTSLSSIFDLAGDEKQTVSFLRGDLIEVQQAAEDALSAFQATHPEKSAAAAARGAGILTESVKKISQSPLSNPTKRILTEALNSKLKDFQKAVSAVLGICLIARTDDATAAPGEKEPIGLYVYNQGPEKITISRASIATAQDKGTISSPTESIEGKQVAGGAAAFSRFAFEISPKAGVTEPFWHLENSGNARYTISPNHDEFAPFDPPELRAEVLYKFQGEEFPIDAPGRAQAGDPLRGADFVELQIVPALSVTLNPEMAIAPGGSSGRTTHEFQVSILNNQKSGARGTVKLLVPSGWHVEPSEAQFDLSRKGETHTVKFVLQISAQAKPGRYPIEAVAVMGGQEFRRGYQVISYPENWTRNFYSPARSRIEKFDVRIAPNLTVGYIPGAGDDVPAALEELGVKVRMLSSADLAFGDLSRFPVIVTGIRAYNVNEDLRADNQRLLDFVRRGGTLIVQYVRPMGRPARGNAGSPFLFGPYPMSVSDTSRITVEDSPVRLLDTMNPIFNRPNKITEADFQGWVQERGLYFMNTWDPHYTALLSGNDPGEEPKNGGMLYVRYGKGHYIYTGYSWFRQLPAGVPGAFRIFANMLSLGHP